MKTLSFAILLLVASTAQAVAPGRYEQVHPGYQNDELTIDSDGWVRLTTSREISKFISFRKDHLPYPTRCRIEQAGKLEADEGDDLTFRLRAFYLIGWDSPSSAEHCRTYIERENRDARNLRFLVQVDLTKYRRLEALAAEPVVQSKIHPLLDNADIRAKDAAALDLLEQYRNVQDSLPGLRDQLERTNNSLRIERAKYFSDGNYIEDLKDQSRKLEAAIGARIQLGKQISETMALPCSEYWKYGSNLRDSDFLPGLQRICRHLKNEIR